MSGPTLTAREKIALEGRSTCRRVYKRHPCRIPAMCQPASVQEMKELSWDATIVDISQGGVRLALARRFEKGTALAVELPGDGQFQPSIVFVRVMHLQAQTAGGWALGCKFLSELSEDQVARLLEARQYVLSPKTVNGTQDELEV